MDDKWSEVLDWLLGFIRQWAFLIILIAVLGPFVHLLFPDSWLANMLRLLENTDAYQTVVPDTSIQSGARECPLIGPCPTPINVPEEQVQKIFLECIGFYGGPTCKIDNVAFSVAFFVFSFVNLIAYLLSVAAFFKPVARILGASSLANWLGRAELANRIFSPIKALLVPVFWMYIVNVVNSLDIHYSYSIPDLEHIWLVTVLVVGCSVGSLIVRARAGRVA